MQIEGHFIAIKHPIKCSTPGLYLLTKEESIGFVLHFSSLHVFLQENKKMNIHILPFGKVTDIKVDELLRKHKCIQQYSGSELRQKKKPQLPCYVHKIFGNPIDVYGVDAKMKAGKSINTIFNKYKKISRNT
jgi:hypothetical protein